MGHPVQSATFGELKCSSTDLFLQTLLDRAIIQ